MPKVLIIDDDPHVSGLLKTYLSEEGCEVTLTQQGEEGYQEAMRSNPDVILLDVMLPDQTGFQLCNRLRKAPATQSTPIIMLTGVARNPNQEGYARERGANEYVHKPFRMVEVGDLVQRYLRKSTR
jgi:DNA-binding response OmpR family regulator